MRTLRRTLPLFIALLVLAALPLMGIGCNDNTGQAKVPVADFGLDNDSPLVGQEIRFTDRSLNNPTAWYWDFGDSSTSTEENPSHAYQAVGMYSVTLKVSNSAGSDAKVWASLVRVTEQPEPTHFTITDDLGTTYAFDEPVHSIVSIAPSNTEIVYAVGAGYKLVGRTTFCNYPVEAAAVPTIGSFWSPDKEAILLKDPDVVLATSAHAGPGGVTEWLKENGVKVVTLMPETIEDILGNIFMVGELAGLEDKAQAVVDDMQATINYVQGKTASLSAAERPSVLHVTWHNPLWTAGADTFTNGLIELAGGTNVFADLTGDVQVATDTAVLRNPQVMTVVTGHGSAASSSFEYMIAADSPFKNCDCYLNSKIYMIDSDLASRPGPRIVQALSQYAQFIHPEIFGNPS